MSLTIDYPLSKIILSIWFFNQLRVLIPLTKTIKRQALASMQWQSSVNIVPFSKILFLEFFKEACKWIHDSSSRHYLHKQATTSVYGYAYMFLGNLGMTFAYQSLIPKHNIYAFNWGLDFSLTLERMTHKHQDRVLFCVINESCIHY